MATASDDDRIDAAGNRVTREELQARCQVLEPGIVLVREHPEANAAILEALMSCAAEIGATFGNYAIVLDLAEAKRRPDPDMVRVIIKTGRTMGVHWAVIRPGSMVIHTIIRFVMARVWGSGGVGSVHNTREEALAAARAALAAAQD